MNNIVLSGVIRNIRYSHEINDALYNKAELIVPNREEDDVISLRFKQSKNHYKDGQQIDIIGNIRSYTETDDEGKNHVQVYVFTYFDIPETNENNVVSLDGRICKKDKLRRTKSGDRIIHFTLANNIFTEYHDKKINSYIPCTAFGKLAKKIDSLEVSDVIKVEGKLHSRTYAKHLPNGEVEFKVAHEVVINNIEVEQ